jgi:hypothetical protein
LVGGVWGLGLGFHRLSRSAPFTLSTRNAASLRPHFAPSTTRRRPPQVRPPRSPRPRQATPGRPRPRQTTPGPTGPGRDFTSNATSPSTPTGTPSEFCCPLARRLSEPLRDNKQRGRSVHTHSCLKLADLR